MTFIRPMFMGTHYAANIMKSGYENNPDGLQADIYELAGLRPSPDDRFIDSRVFARKQTIEFYLEHLTKGLKSHSMQVVNNNSILLQSGLEYLEVTEAYALAAK